MSEQPKPHVAPAPGATTETGDEELRRSKAAFLAMISHEIRTPLNGLLGIAGLLTDSGLTAEQKQLVDIADRSGRQLRRIINDILDFSRLSEGGIAIEQSTFRPATLIDGVVALVRGGADMKQLSIDSFVAADVPDFAVGDHERIRQVLFCLAENAVKFTEMGGVSISAEARSGPEGERLLFTVADSGIGIASERMDGLFEVFNVGDARYTRRIGGSGLGLALSRALVRAMNGSIGVDSQIGKGARFWFELPLEIGSDGAQPDPKRQVDRSDEMPALYGLIVEDNVVSQLEMMAALESLGCRADVVSDGNEAVEAAASRSYDFIVMDLVMPRMGGLEAAVQIRKQSGHNAATPIIALSSYARDEDHKHVVGAGMNEALSKPVSRAALEDALRRLTQPKTKPESQPMPDTGMAQHFDRSVLTTALGGLPLDLQRRLLDEFRRDVVRQIEALQAAGAIGDRQALKTASFALKSLSGTYGAVTLHNSAKLLAHRCEATDFALLRDEIEALQDLSSRVLTGLAEVDLA